MKKDWLFSAEDYICDVRTVGVLVRDGKILLQREAGGDEYALPGGHIKIGETMEAGLIREYLEETGAAVRCQRLLWSEECFWNWNGRQAHNIAFYYLIALEDGSGIPDTGDFVSQKDNCNVLLGWLPVEALESITVYPSFLKEEIYHLDDPIKHFVTKT